MTAELRDGARYEALYTRMQEIVALLEAGDLPLDEMLALYEEGVSVAGACQRILDQAALRVQRLQGGQLSDDA
jgi:exodeoxyribonuclease VII small subunit